MNMKYKTAKVVGHPRSGSHYLAHLLNINFFHLKNYLPLYAGHSDHHKQHLKSGHTAVFYIYRNNEDTIKSIFNLRYRFGLNVDSIEELKANKLSDLKDMGVRSTAVCNVPGKYEVVHGPDAYLGSHKQTIEEYLNAHKGYWTNLVAPNYYLVRYEDLKDNFQVTMEDIAYFLNGCEEGQYIEYKNESARVGWYDRKDPEKKFS